MGGPAQIRPGLGPDLLCQRRPFGSGKGRERRTRWRRSERSDGSLHGLVREFQQTGNPSFLLDPPVAITPRVCVAPDSV